jgi:hypothetical protein
LEAAVASGGVSTLQQIGATLVQHLSPLKPHKVANEVRKKAASNSISTSFAGTVAIGKSGEDSDKHPTPPLDQFVTIVVKHPLPLDQFVTMNLVV